MATMDGESMTAEERKQKFNGKKEAANDIIHIIEKLDKNGKLSSELDILIYTIKKRYDV